MNNCVMCVGKIVGNPQIREFDSGTKKASFGLLLMGCGDRKTNGEEGYEPAFIDCECWGKPLEFIEKLGEEKPWVSLVGSLKTHSWEDSSSGAKRTKTYILVSSINFLPGSKQENAGEITDEPTV